MSNMTSNSYICPFYDPQPLIGHSFLVAKLAVDVLITIAILLGNLFIVCALWKHRYTRRSTIFVLNLALGDLLSGASLMYYYVMSNVCYLAELAASSPVMCLSKLMCITFTGMICMNSLAAIALDRYLCIVHSLRYSEYMTTRRAAAIIAGVWLVSSVGAFSLPLSHSWAPGYPCRESFVIVKWHLFLVTMPMNLLVLAIVSLTHLRIRAEIFLSNERRRASGGCVFGIHHQNNTIKSAKTVTLVIACYFLAYTPVLTVLQLRSLEIGSDRGMDLAFSITFTLANANSLVNPFIYSWRSASLNTEMLALWRRIRGRAEGEGRGGGRRRGGIRGTVSGTSTSCGPCAPSPTPSPSPPPAPCGDCEVCASGRAELQSESRGRDGGGGGPGPHRCRASPRPHQGPRTHCERHGATGVARVHQLKLMF